MKSIKYLFLILCLCGMSTIQAQDFHNSYIQFAPMTINPALTGAFYGNLRANIIGRDQGRPVTDNHFQDLNIFIDGSINFGFTKGDWISAGLNLARSTVGISEFDENRIPIPSTTSFKRRFQGISLAYHYAYGKRKDKVLTVGAKYGTYSTGLDGNCDGCLDFVKVSTGQTSSDINGLMGSILNESSDYSIGLMLTTPLGKTSDLRIGIAGDHIFTPNLTPPSTTGGMTPNPNPNPNPVPPVVNVPGEDLNRRINAFVSIYTSLSDRLTFNPNLYYQKMGVSTNILLQGLFNLMYDKEKDISFNAGLGVRLVNSTDIPVYLGVEIKDLKVGLSYDTNISGLRPSNNTFGALELGVSKVFSWNKKATVKPVFICPRL